MRWIQRGKDLDLMDWAIIGLNIIVGLINFAFGLIMDSKFMLFCGAISFTFALSIYLIIKSLRSNRWR